MRWLFTEEWNECGKVFITAYGKLSDNAYNDIVMQMEKFSAFDYCCPCGFDSKAEYEICLSYRKKDPNNVISYKQ